ncbi:hypothetical protein OC835_003202 [Tilletia horrida]|nr:hypothetical protein OC835_003202 [Tilletia horrida]
MPPARSTSSGSIGSSSNHNHNHGYGLAGSGGVGNAPQPPLASSSSRSSVILSPILSSSGRGIPPTGTPPASHAGSHGSAAGSGSGAGVTPSVAARSEGTSMPAPGELKPQKACVGCRRSKVKCIHDGGPPCRRCLDTGQECKFRLRADDERWRERTDETLSKLSQAVETLITRGVTVHTAAPSGQGQGGAPPPSSSSYHPYAPTPAHTVPLRQSATFASESSGGGGPGSTTFPPFTTSRSSSFLERNYPFNSSSPSGSIHGTSSADAALAQPLAGPSTPSDRDRDRSGSMGGAGPGHGAHSYPHRSPGPYAFGPLQALSSSSASSASGGTVMRDASGEDARMADAVPSSSAASSSSTHNAAYAGPGPGPAGMAAGAAHRVPLPPPSTSHFASLHSRSASGSSSTLAMLPPPIPSNIGSGAAGGGGGGGMGGIAGPGLGMAGGGGGGGVGLPPGMGTGTPYPGQRMSAAAPTLTMPPALIPGLNTMPPPHAAGAASSSTSSAASAHVSAPAPLPIDPDQTLPSSLLLQVGAEAASLLAASTGASITAGAPPVAALLGAPYDGGGGAGGAGAGANVGGGGVAGMGAGGFEVGRVRWHVGAPSAYASPALHLGRDDPRLNAISLGLIPMEKARSLFVFFAEWLQPHSFGFPTYAASEQMTPLIISCILTVASLFDPTAQTAAYHHTVRQDALNQIKVDQVMDGPHMPLDPELGIGVEEVTGAAILSAWLGGEVAFKIARVVRFWAIGYLRHFELPSRNVTLGECLTILPPFRQIDLCDKLRIWLTAYLVEAQQCFLFDRPSLAPDQNPQPYCQALRAAFRDTEPAFAVPPADRQLIAHAGILGILLEAQTIQRERRWERDAKAQLMAQFQQAQQRYFQLQQQASGQSNGHGSDGSGSTSDETPGSAAGVGGPGPAASSVGPPPQPPTVAQEVAQGLRNLVAFGRDWIEDVERWMVAARKLEDLSNCTGISLDITLMYHLSRAWLGSSALEASRVLNSMTTTHGDEARAITQGLDSLFDVVEHQVIRAAKDGALRALQLASNRTEGFADRLAYLPSIYHFLLSHAASFALLLVQRHRRWRYCMGSEAAELLRCAEEFVAKYTFAIQAHGVNNEEHAGSVRHPSRATCQALLRALQQAKASI